MDHTTAREHYNRICGLISVLEDMKRRFKPKMNKRDLNDTLYMGSLDSTVNFLSSLRERTPWTPVDDKPGEGYL